MSDEVYGAEDCAAFGLSQHGAKRKECAVSLVALVVAVMLFSGCSAASPLRRSEAAIRVSLLKKTPTGATREVVGRFMAKEKWYPSPVPSNPNEWAPSALLGAANSPPAWRKVTSALRTDCGSYWGFPFYSRIVFGVWGFDASDQLVDIWVYKETGSF